MLGVVMFLLEDFYKVALAHLWHGKNFILKLDLRMGSVKSDFKFSRIRHAVSLSYRTIFFLLSGHWVKVNVLQSFCLIE